MAQAITGGVLAQDVQSGGKPFDAPADLILLVNSAGRIDLRKRVERYVRTDWPSGFHQSESPLADLDNIRERFGHWQLVSDRHVFA